MRESYISANAFPSKIMINPILIQDVKKHYIRPLHIQLNPTNKCTLNCSFCSCKNRTKTEELPFSEIDFLLRGYHSLGCKAVTLTGGGEPLCHPDIEKIISLCIRLHMKVGITTNGTLLGKKKLDGVTWVRISLSDEATMDLNTLPQLPADTAFSYVLLQTTNYKYLQEAVIYAQEHNFTHMRLVDDILGSKDDRLHEAQESLRGIDKGIVIYQGRKIYTQGANKCFISLLKPNIGADGNIYPCCGVQYLDDSPARTFPLKYSMGTLQEIELITYKQKYFDGSVCYRCYYGEYNYALNLLWGSENIKHKEFI